MKSLRKLHYGYRKGISSYCFNTLWLLVPEDTCYLSPHFFNQIFKQWVFCSGTCCTSKGYLLSFYVKVLEMLSRPVNGFRFFFFFSSYYISRVERKTDVSQMVVFPQT